MRSRTKLISSITVSIVISAIIACLVYFMLQEVKIKLGQNRDYDEVIFKANALDNLLAELKQDFELTDLTQIQDVFVSLGDLLNQAVSADPVERSVIVQIRSNYESLRLLLNQLAVSGVGRDSPSLEDRKAMIDTQILIKVRRMAEDVHRLGGLNMERVISIQSRNGIAVLLLLAALIIFNTLVFVISHRKFVQSQESLHEREERLNYVLEGSREGFWDWDLKTGEVNRNERWAQMLGYSFKDIAFSVPQWEDLVHPEDKPRAWQSITDHLKGKTEHHECEYRMLNKSGDWVWILDRARVVKLDGDGKPARMAGTHTDVSQRKKAEEALVKSESKYRLLAENMKDVIWGSDSNLGLEYLSPSVKDLLGYEPEEIMGVSFLDLLTTESRNRAQPFLDKRSEFTMPHKPPLQFSYEVEMIRKDGSRVWAEIVSNPVIESNGTLLGFQGVARDVSERKDSERALQESESMFRSYVESSPIGIFETDSDGRLVSANKACSSVTGYSNETLLKSAIFDFLPHETVPKVTAKFQRLMLSGYENADLEIITFSGKIIWESVHAIKLSDNRFLFYIIDITERKQAEENLKAASNQTLQLMHSMISGFVVFESVFDESGQFVDCRYVLTNDAFGRILGISSEEVIGKTINEVWPDTEQAWIQNFKDVALSGIGKSFEMSHEPTRKCYYCTIYRPKESTDRTCLMFEDITERKQAQEELLEMERKLFQSQKLESLGVLAGGIAHDFNNLLAVIVGNIELAQESGFNSAEKELFLERAMSASMKSARLIRQMLDYSGKGAFELNDVNLSELVNNNIDMFRMSVPKNINLRVDGTEDDIFIKADLSQIQQVIMNLLINASEAIGGGTGAIEISTGAQYCNESVISQSLLPEKPKPQDMAFIRVRDDGSGMDVETVQRIFDPFFSTKFVGRGLGMSVVHGVVRGHTGVVTIDSEPGVGTTIVVYLPLLYRTRRADGAHDNVKPSASSTEEKSAEKNKLSVLVVDDEQEVLDLVLNQLQHLGCETLSAMNGKEALDVFSQNPQIDFVILDLIMPEMGGVETFDRLKALRPDMAVVICSGYNEEQIKDGFKSKFQPTAFVTKPYSLSTLKDLTELLRGKHYAYQ